MRRIFVIVGVLIVIGGGLVLARQSFQAGGAAEPAQQILDETSAQIGNLRLTVSATGAVTPAKQVALLFESSGMVHDVLVSVGDQVRAGDPLAVLDTTDLEAALADAQVAFEVQRIAYETLISPPRETDLAAAQAALNTALASLNAAYSSTNPNQAEIAQLQSEIARNRLWQAQLQRDAAANTSGFTPDISGLIPDGVDVSPDVINQINQGLSGLLPSVAAPDASSFDPGLRQAEYGVEIADANAAGAADQTADPGSVGAANAAAVQARAALDKLENGPSDFDLQTAEINLSMAQLAVDQAQAALDRATLVAPFDGVIAQNNLVVGELPPSNNAALILIDDGRLYVDLAIDETDVVKVAVGQAVEFNFDALPDSAITGTVMRVAVTPTVAGQLVTYPVRVTLDPTNQPIRIGMSATAIIILDELNDVLVLPNRFIRIDRTTQQAYVTVADESGRTTEIPVELGLRSDIDSQISAGLEPGQRVVLLPRAAFDPLSN